MQTNDNQSCKCLYCGNTINKLGDDLQTTNQICDKCIDHPERKAFFNMDKPVTLTDLKEGFKKWLYLEGDDEVIDIVLAAALDRKFKGDPLWIFLISPSGGTKTEIVRTLSASEKIYTLDSLTTKSLISGKLKNVEGKQVPVMGILPEIDGKVLVIKDFTTILNMRPDDRDAIYSQLRTLYDGYIEQAFGTLETPLRIKAVIGLIAAVTPIIDQYNRFSVTLGERFLKVRHHPNSEKATRQAMKNLSKETEMREELEEFAKRFLDKTVLTSEVNPMTEEQMDAILSIAQATAILRTPVTLNIWRNEVQNAIQVTIEYPTRLAKQLSKLAYLLAAVRGQKEVTYRELQTVQRVARDTAVPNRIKILEAIKDDLAYTTRELAEKTGIPLSTCWRELKELEYLGVAHYQRYTVTLQDGERVAISKPEEDGWQLVNITVLKILKSEFAKLFVSQTTVKGGIGGNNNADEGSPVLSETNDTSAQVSREITQ